MKKSLSEKFSNFIVKHRKIVIAVAVILIIPAIIGMLTTRVNYDMLNYLPDNMETVIGQDELLKDFNKGAFSIVVVEDLSENQISTLESKISGVNHVETVLGLGALADKNIPAEILPDSLYETFIHGNESLMAVFFDTSTSADETITAVNEIRDIVDGHAYVSGMSALVTDLRNLCEDEEIIYVIIAVVLALIVMLIFLDNWLAPILFLANIGIMILINMGTNFIFGEISYITKALSAVLQLAVTMDYSIFLWHSYREFKSEGKNNNEAMANAIKATLSSVIGGSTTTIAGFIALCFMSFTLGLDLGIVMAKGVVLGVIGSVTLLPSLILICDRALEKLEHRPVLPQFEKVSSKVIKLFPVFIALMIAIIPPAYIGYKNSNNNVYYELSESLPSDMEFAVAKEKLSNEFNMANVHMILTKSDLEDTEVRKMTNEIEKIDGVKSVLNLESLVGSNIPTEILPDSLTEILKSNNWELTLIMSEYTTASDEINNQISEINNVIKTYDNSALLIGESSCTKDMIDLTDKDFRIVNSVSIVLIFIIVALVTQSISLPFILITVIETAIFINLGIPYFIGSKLSFITPICISTIQLGATIDYAILLTTRYKKERMNGLDKKEATKIALKTSLPSIIVSGLGLFAATFGVAMYSNVDMISSICLLIASGAIISVLCIALFLPSLLILLDRIICKTTKGMTKIK